MHTTAQEGTTQHDTELALDQLERHLRDVRTVLAGYRDGITALIDAVNCGLEDLNTLRQQN